jgi:hypothetical protein
MNAFRLTHTRSLKELWHRDLVADPATHAWVLNLYRAGEKHPQTVSDYFPHRHAPTPDLAERLRRHAGDEARHVRMYTGAIERLGEEVEERVGAAVFNQVIRDCTRVDFRIDERDAEAERCRKLAHFLAHAHFLERRIAQSLQFHLAACEFHRRHEIAAVVAAVLADEERHVAYSLAAVHELVTRADAEGLIETHRRGERLANLRFSAERVRECLRTLGKRLPLRHRALYAAASVLQEVSALG